MLLTVHVNEYNRSPVKRTLQSSLTSSPSKAMAGTESSFNFKQETMQPIHETWMVERKDTSEYHQDMYRENQTTGSEGNFFLEMVILSVALFPCTIVLTIEMKNKWKQ